MNFYTIINNKSKITLHFFHLNIVQYYFLFINRRLYLLKLSHQQRKWEFLSFLLVFFLYKFIRTPHLTFYILKKVELSRTRTYIGNLLIFTSSIFILYFRLHNRLFHLLHFIRKSFSVTA